MKKDLKDGRVQIEQILSNPPEYVSTAKVFDMLMAVPKFGRVKAARFLNMCRISQSKTVGGLSDRQRSELIGLFNRLSRWSSSSPARRVPARGTLEKVLLERDAGARARGLGDDARCSGRRE